MVVLIHLQWYRVQPKNQEQTQVRISKKMPDIEGLFNSNLAITFSDRKCVTNKHDGRRF